MRVSLFAILPIALALASTATATANYDHDFEARDYIDDLATRDYEDDSILGARHLLVDISTRDLVDELTRRRGLVKFKCKTCGAKFGKSGDEAQAHKFKFIELPKDQRHKIESYIFGS